MRITVEITKIEVKKTLSNDKEFKVTFVTPCEDVLQLQKYINESTVEIEVHDDK